jgi:hypothetical protein
MHQSPLHQIDANADKSELSDAAKKDLNSDKLNADAPPNLAKSNLN